MHGSFEHLQNTNVFAQLLKACSQISQITEAPVSSAGRNVELQWLYNKWRASCLYLLVLIAYHERKRYICSTTAFCNWQQNNFTLYRFPCSQGKCQTDFMVHTQAHQMHIRDASDMLWPIGNVQCKSVGRLNPAAVSLRWKGEISQYRIHNGNVSSSAFCDRRIMKKTFPHGMKVSNETEAFLPRGKDSWAAFRIPFHPSEQLSEMISWRQFSNVFRMEGKYLFNYILSSHAETSRELTSGNHFIQG